MRHSHIIAKPPGRKTWLPFVYEPTPTHVQNYNPLTYDRTEKEYHLSNTGQFIGHDIHPEKKYSYGRALENLQYNFGKGRGDFVHSQKDFIIPQGRTLEQVNQLDYSNYYNCRK